MDRASRSSSDAMTATRQQRECSQWFPRCPVATHVPPGLGVLPTAEWLRRFTNEQVARTPLTLCTRNVLVPDWQLAANRGTLAVTRAILAIGVVGRTGDMLFGLLCLAYVPFGFCFADVDDQV